MGDPQPCRTPPCAVVARRREDERDRQTGASHDSKRRCLHRCHYGACERAWVAKGYSSCRLSLCGCGWRKFKHTTAAVRRPRMEFKPCAERGHAKSRPATIRALRRRTLESDPTRAATRLRAPVHDRRPPPQCGCAKVASPACAVPQIAPRRSSLLRINAKPCGNGKWIARCPGHEDQHPSLAISKGRDGRTLLRCFAGCSVEVIARI
jgi:hypothetical protein